MEKIIEKLTLNLEDLLEYQKNRPPYLMMDEATEVIPGKSAKGYRIFHKDEWFFKCHFPGDPSVPGALQLEAMMQVASLIILTLPGNKGKVCYVVSATDLKWSRKILPGERLDIDTEMLSWKRGIAICVGVGAVEKQPTCRAKFMIAVPDILKTFQR